MYRKERIALLERKPQVGGRPSWPPKKRMARNRAVQERAAHGAAGQELAPLEDLDLGGDLRPQPQPPGDPKPPSSERSEIWRGLRERPRGACRAAEEEGFDETDTGLGTDAISGWDKDDNGLLVDEEEAWIEARRHQRRQRLRARQPRSPRQPTSRVGRDAPADDSLLSPLNAFVHEEDGGRDAAGKMNLFFPGREGRHALSRQLFAHGHSWTAQREAAEPSVSEAEVSKASTQKALVRSSPEALVAPGPEPTTRAPRESLGREVVPPLPSKSSKLEDGLEIVRNGARAPTPISSQQEQGPSRLAGRKPKPGTLGAELEQRGDDAAALVNGAMSMASMMRELERLAPDAKGTDGPAWSKLCTGLCVRAYELPSEELLRAVRLLARGAASFLANPETSKLSEELRGTTETLLASIGARLRESDAHFVADALQTMAGVRVGEQIHLDMMVAQLLVLLKKEPGSFGPRVMMRIVNALGVMYEDMKLNAQKTTGGARFLEGMNKRMTQKFGDILDDDMGLLHPAYLLRFCDDNFKRAILYRAAQLQLGRRPENREHLTAMKRVEQAMREHSFAFVSTLPHFTKDYMAGLQGGEVGDESRIGALARTG